MTVAMEDRLRHFATSLLERRGALVEWPDDQCRGTALLPLPVADAVGTSEVTPLGPDVAGEGLSVNLAGDFLEWSGRLLQVEPWVGVFRVRNLYLKRKEVAEGIARTFSWLNAKVKVRDAHEATTEYHTWWFHGVLTSDDRWETQFSLSLNADSGVIMAIPDPLTLWELEPRPSARPTAATSYPRAMAEARRRLLSLAGDFVERMDVRLQRDRKRLHDYYRALVREASQKKTRGRSAPDPEKLTAANRAVQLELSRKLAELDERYAMTATVTPVIVVCTETPVLAVDVAVHRKQSQRTHRIYWNPLIKQFEPLLCSRCGQPIFGVAFTNDTVEPLCSTCHASAVNRAQPQATRS